VFKRNNVIRFLGDGDKVKASLRFRGREMAHIRLGRDVLDRLVRDVGDRGIVEFRPRMEGNTMHVILAPSKTKAEAQKPPKSSQPSPQGQAGAQ
jgi:translation initiation factor IF-3